MGSRRGSPSARQQTRLESQTTRNVLPAWTSALVLAIALSLRLWNLGGPPLWVDEAQYAITLGTLRQEWPAQLISLMLPRSEFWLRLPFAIAGSLTCWWVARKHPFTGLVITTFPLLVFWSRMARPYTLAGFFMVLG